MRESIPSTPAQPRLRIVVLNNSAAVVKMLCGLFTHHGHECDTKLIAELSRPHEDVGQFIAQHRPDVVVYDVGKPYACSWDLLDVIRASPALRSKAFVLTTPNKADLDEAVGPTGALEITEHTQDLRRLLYAVVEAAEPAGLNG